MSDHHQSTNEETISTSVSALDENNSMERGLSNRHVQFIAIGGAIGTGLFLGAGKSISLTGPSILLIYIVVGVMMFVMMRAIGELMYRDPSQHTFINFIRYYMGNGAGKFALWSYWLVLILSGMTELTAVGQYCVTFFATFGVDIKSWQWAIELGFLIVLIAVNLIAVKAFGEAEFWFATIKIILIVALIATAIVMLCMGYHYGPTRISGQDHVSAGGSVSLGNIFHDFQLAPHGWLAFFMSFQMVFFAYQMMEFIGVTVSETANPRKVLPKAVNGIVVRVLIFYVGALAAIMTIVPWKNFEANEDGTFASPFIMVFEFAGLHWAAGLVFFVVITAAASSLNSILYSCGRHLYQIASEADHGPLKKLDGVSATKVPARAIIASAIIIMVSPLVSLIPGVTGLFVMFSSAASSVIIFIYILVMLSHRKYRVSPEFMPKGFLMPAYKVLDIAVIIFFVFIYCTLFLASDTRISAIGGIAWLLVFGGYCMVKYRNTERIPLSMDDEEVQEEDKKVMQTEF